MTHVELTWYGYLMIGFGIGMYLHCHRIRHLIHWLLVKVMSGFIWLLHKTDKYYVPPEIVEEEIIEPMKPEKHKVPKIIGNNKQGEIEIQEDDLNEWLSKNPDISVQGRM